MTATKRLLQLLRITQQDNALRGLRDGDDVYQRHLPGFVHEKHIHGFEIILLRPEPRGSCKDMGSAKESGERLLRLDRRLNMWRVALRLIGVFYFLDAFHTGQLLLASGFHNFVKKVSDHLVA